MRSRSRNLVLAALLITSLSAFAQAKSDARLKGSYRLERANWIYVHLEGSPAQVGFQHGSLLAKEIDDAFQAVKYKDTYRTKREWSFFRDTAKNVLWPKIEKEYRDELQGIADGAASKGVKIDLWDVVAVNAMEEVPDYYIPWLEKNGRQARLPG